MDPAELTIETVPARLRERGDPGAEIDDVAYPLEPLLELADRDEHEGIGDAPWPPHFPKAEGEPPRVQPSKRRKPPTAAAEAGSKKSTGTGRRKSSKPLVEIARAETKDEAMAGLERWKARHPEVTPASPRVGRARRLDARPAHELDADPRQPREGAEGTTSGAGAP